MTIPLPPALPPHFNIGGYKITALVESGPDYHLYQALSPEGHAVLLTYAGSVGMLSVAAVLMYQAAWSALSIAVCALKQHS